MAADHIDGERTAAEGEVKRLGDRPSVIAFSAGSATVEVAASSGRREIRPAADTRPDTSPHGNG